MPAHDFEIEEALEEGVVVNWLSTITSANEKGFKIEKMVMVAHSQPANSK